MSFFRMSELFGLVLRLLFKFLFKVFRLLFELLSSEVNSTLLGSRVGGFWGGEALLLLILGLVWFTISSKGFGSLKIFSLSVTGVEGLFMFLFIVFFFVIKMFAYLLFKKNFFLKVFLSSREIIFSWLARREMLLEGEKINSSVGEPRGRVGLFFGEEFGSSFDSSVRLELMLVL